MGVLGIGMGLVISQLANVVQSSIGDADRSEAGGLQNTAQQLGSSLGTALLGAVVITGLITAFSANVGSTSGSGGRHPGGSVRIAPVGASSPRTRSARPPLKPGSTTRPPTPSWRTTRMRSFRRSRSPSCLRP